MHTHQTLLLPTSTAELERILRAAAAGGMPDAVHDARPPVLALKPLLQALARGGPPPRASHPAPVAKRGPRTRVMVPMAAVGVMLRP